MKLIHFLLPVLFGLAGWYGTRPAWIEVKVAVKLVSFEL
jgi:hypothetical protein